VVLGEVGGQLVGEVLSAACLRCPKLGDLADGAAQPVGVTTTIVFLGPDDLAVPATLQSQQASTLPRGE
jgi:hypothetical protein